MQEALLVTTTIAVLLFVGVICSFVASKLKLPDMLLLILAGMLFGKMQFKGESLVQFPEVFLSSVSILALAMIVFDSTARIRLRELDNFSLKAIRLMFIFTVLILALFSVAAHFILGLPLWSSILFATLMVGTSPEALLPLASKAREVVLLKLESIFNTPITVILPFLVIDFMKIKTSILSEIIEQTTPLVMNIIVGIGTGVFVGLILFKLVQHVYTEVYSPLAVIVAALLSYVLAENLGGSGVLAVTALGFFFGNVYVKEKVTLLGMESVLTKALYIFVFMLTGVAINIPLTTEFFITSGILFITYLGIRFIASYLSVHSEGYTLGEITYIALNAPKGIATATVVFSLLFFDIEGLTIILDMTFAFILYTIILSTITTWAYENHLNRHQLPNRVRKA